MGFGVWGLGFGVWGLGFGVWGLGFGAWGLGLGVWGSGLERLGTGVEIERRLRVQDLGLRVQEFYRLGFRVQGSLNQCQAYPKHNIPPLHTCCATSYPNYGALFFGRMWRAGLQAQRILGFRVWG